MKAEKLKTTRCYRGNVPLDGVKVATVQDDWVLFLRPNHGQHGWEAFKLVWLGDEGVPKANFWFGWNGDRFARSKDITRLKEDLPELYIDLVDTLNRYSFGRIGEVAA